MDWGKIFVVTRYQPQLPARTCESFIELFCKGLRPGDQRDYVHSKTMHKAANMLARKFLQSACDSICFIDSDAEFGWQALNELRDDVEGQDYDVLQAFATKRGWPPEPMYLIDMPDQPTGLDARRGYYVMTGLPLDPDFIYPVAAVSLHFTLIRRWVFEALLDPDGPEHTYWFEYSRDMGEDTTFSFNARRVNAKLGMTTRLKVGHIGEMTTGWDTMSDFYAQKFAREIGEPAPDLRRFLPYWEAQKQLSALVAEFTGEPADLVYQRSLQGHLPVADRWKREHPQSADDVRGFYGSSADYLYDLIKWNASPAYQRILSVLKPVRDERVLEIGGGLGTLAEMLLVSGNRVDYHDLPGVLLDFARWRLQRLPDPQVNFLADPRGSQSEVFDRVVAVDVIEHIHPDEIGELLFQLHRVLKPGGALTVHNNFEVSATYPQHFDHSAVWAEFVQQFTQLDDFTWRKNP